MPPRANALGLGLPTTVRQPVVAAPAGHAPPQRIVIAEPPRRTPRPMPLVPPNGALHSAPRNAAHKAGIQIPGPPMLRPSELDGVLSATRERARQWHAHHARAVQAAPVPRRVAAPGSSRGVGAPVSAATRTTQSVQSSSGTGINPWWRYQEENIPGGGHLMINVGTGNVVLQDDDMSVAHKGLGLAFRRTYNSQSLHDMSGSEGTGGLWARPSMYGNGWTNTFDAHLVRTSPTSYSVYDIDGARYDYVANDPNDARNGYTGPPGQHAVLAWDGGCGVTWTKKSGTLYYFYTDNPGCPSGGANSAFAGRLYRIIGRNRNTYLAFFYSWDNGDISAGGKVNTMSVQTESGLTATLVFADIGGHRLLDHIVWPDGTTIVAYGYDTLGNMVNVSRPPNNAAGSRPGQWLGYQTLGGASVLSYVTSPRWNGSDGGYVNFGFSGSSVATATLWAMGHIANANPTIADGTNSGALQPGRQTTPWS